MNTNNTNYEIERKFLVRSLPENLDSYPHAEFEQGYLSTAPVVRVRREGEDYVLTYKSAGLMKREEYNLPLTEASYAHLLAKADGIVIAKTRYRIGAIELDVFHKSLAPLVLAEVEFDSEEAAEAFVPPEWFGREVTMDGRFHNSRLSEQGLPEDFPSS